MADLIGIAIGNIIGGLLGCFLAYKWMMRETDEP